MPPPRPLRVALQLFISPRQAISARESDSALSSTRRNHLPAFCALCRHPSNFIPKTDISTFRCPIQSFSCPPENPLTPTSSPNITVCGRRSSPVRATNPANKISSVCALWPLCSRKQSWLARRRTIGQHTIENRRAVGLLNPMRDKN